MIFRLFLVLFFLSNVNFVKASNNIKIEHKNFQLIIESQEQLNAFKNDSIVKKTVKFKRGKAIVLSVLTGFLGGHRIYFGTHQRTPIIYSITLGGLGLLAFVDLVHIIFTKDLSKFENKSQIIMWGK